jgi:amino acid adenylation domain-containing protein
MSDLTSSVADPALQQSSGQSRRVYPTNAYIPFTKAEIEQSIPARFEQQLGRYPDRLAIKTGNQSLTYEELNRAANRVARGILAQQGPGEEPVALLFDHGAAVLVTILGVLKAGKMYVPLDPSYPLARTAYILEHAQARLLVTDTPNLPLAKTLARDGCGVLDMEEIDAALSDENVGLALAPDALSYILYTSGSTGQPKGIVQNHRNVLHNIMKYTNGSHICADDRLSLLFSVSYSAAVTNIFGALLNGAALFPFNLKEEGLGNLVDWLTREEITVYHSVTTVFRRLLDALTGAEAFPKLRLIELTGEPVSPREVERFKYHFPPHCLLHNRMAATEMSLIRQYFIGKETPITGSTVPVGYAVADTDILLLDETGEEVGVGQIGEIAIKSPYLALGYWRRPDLTQAAFVPDPAGGSARIYRTGDLGRMRPDGCLEHLGRKDFQVKIRGHRVETAEIETALLEHTVVKEAIVLAQEDGRGDKRLVAYVVPARKPEPTVSELRSFVQAKLPDYMVPSAFVRLEVLPLLPNGKVDRRALPVPDMARPELDTAFVGPRTPVEEELAGIWTDVLKLDHVGLHDNFLELGGDSLLAAEVISRVRQAFHVDLSLRDFFKAPTVAGLAGAIVQHQAEQAGPEEMTRILAELEEQSHG